MNTDAAEEPEETEDGDLPTSEQLLRARAIQKPDVLALLDPPNRQALRLGTPRSFTYSEADAATDALAAVFSELGLGPGDTVAAQLPNFALSPLTLLAAWRAGLTVAALPMLWRGYEIAKVCAELEPRALIGVSRFADDAPMDVLTAVADQNPSLRFVLGFGPDLPANVTSLDEAIDIRRDMAPVETKPREGPALITFTARAGAPFLAIEHGEEELLAQGAMTVLALGLDRSDVILNAYPLTGPAGLSLGFLPWLISGATLAQHHPFDYEVFAGQLTATGATVTALPAPALAQLAKDGVPQKPQCRLRQVGVVWTGVGQAEPLTVPFGNASDFFDLYPLGDLASVVIKRKDPANPAGLPLGEVSIRDDGDDSDDSAFVETKLAPRPALEGYGEILLRGPIVPSGQTDGPLAPDGDLFVATGLLGKTGSEADTNLQLKEDPELLRHGGLSIAVCEFDELYQSFPAFLDAACLVLPDPQIGDRVIAAVVPRPGELVAIEALNRYLEERSVAHYKIPDRILMVRRILRDEDGRILRDRILLQV